LHEHSAVLFHRSASEQHLSFFRHRSLVSTSPAPTNNTNVKTRCAHNNAEVKGIETKISVPSQ
jgi:hypothetical protein